LTYELSWPNAPQTHYEVHFGKRISAWGYIWIFPKRDQLNVGITVFPSKGRSAREMDARLCGFIEQRDELRHLTLLRRVAGHIPLAPARRIYDEAMLVVGDAGGMVEAFSEAGIANAIVSGRMAGQVACEALETEETSSAFLSRYQRRWHATERHRTIRFQAQLTQALSFFSRVDGNLYAKTLQVLFLGDQLSRWQKLRLLGYPLLKAPFR
jgi:digeranylgeranylglycerophospholipid reductase